MSGCARHPHRRLEERASLHARAEAGYNVDQTANDIGMTCGNVEQDTPFRDRMQVGADGKKRLGRVTNKD
jgi:hypothetical protein